MRKRDVTGRCTVGFVLMSEHSSYYAALGLAHAVRDMGHEALFFVSEKTVFAELVRAHEFTVAAIPPGYESRLVRPGRIARFRLWKRLKRRSESIRREQAFLADMIRANAIDLCFLDAVRYDVYPYALALARAGVPTILLAYTFASRLGTDCPPVFSSAIPPVAARPGARARAVHGLLWAWALGARGRATAFGAIEYAQIVFKKWLNQMRNVSFELALRRLGRPSVWSEWKRRPLLPEIVFGHRALDWPAIASDPARCYFGTTDLFRTSPPFDWSIVAPDKPIVYCNLSTIHGFENISASGASRGAAGVDLSSVRFRMAARYVEAVIECFSRRRDWQLLLACGPFLEGLRGRPLGPNIHLFDRLPQLAVLRRADVAITWGGAGTVRECVTHGVRLVVLPAWTDQFGNAARVAFHNVGVRGDIAGITPQKMTELVERALTDETIRAASSAMQASCDPSHDVRALVGFVAHHTGVALQRLPA